MHDAVAGECGAHCGFDCLTYALAALNIRLDCLESGLDCLLFFAGQEWQGGVHDAAAGECGEHRVRKDARRRHRQVPLVQRGHHPRVDARQSQKSIIRIHRGMDVKRQFPLPLT